MNPKPFSSLNHFTVPVGICVLRVCALRNAEDAEEQRLRKRGALLSSSECSTFSREFSDSRVDFVGLTRSGQGPALDLTMHRPRVVLAESSTRDPASTHQSGAACRRTGRT